MNNRSGVNESSLVNFSSDLPSLDAKDSLLSFPFDHLYACHSEGSEQRDTLGLNKEVALPVPCVVGEDRSLCVGDVSVNQLNERLTASENQNKRLKDLLIFHLDLIQQQNELITTRDKLYQALVQENETLKSKLHRRQGGVSVPSSTSTSLLPPPAPLNLPPPTPVTSTVVKPDSSQVCADLMLNSFSELLLPENRSDPFLFTTELGDPKTFEKETFGIARTTNPDEPGESARPIPMRPIPKKGIYKDVKPFTAGVIGAASTLEPPKPKYSNMRCDGFKAVDSKRSLIKKEVKSEPLYTVTSNSGNPVIQKVPRKKRTSAGVGHLSRMPKNPPKVETPDTTIKAEEPPFTHFGLNKKGKAVNTYGKSRNATTSTATSTTTTMPKRSMFGSLSDRLQLIDTTPTGEDPYQLGEADLREQSPIPKLMLQKTNHGRMKVLDQPTRRIYDPDSPEPKKMRANRFLSELKREPKTALVQEPDMELVKTEPEIDWRIYQSKNKTSIETCAAAIPPLNEFSFGDSPGNAASNISLDCNEFQDLFTSDSALNLEDLNLATSFSSQKLAAEKSKKRSSKIAFMPPLLDTPPEAMDFPLVQPQAPAPHKESKRGRKRAYSTTGLGKGGKGAKVPAKRAARGRGAARGKKTPPPARTTRQEYHTHVGDPDLSWYFGLDPEIKLDDLDPPAEQKSATVEVPRWREKPFTSIDSYDGTENLDDKAFEKRHQKLEAEERRQLRWHMRRIREQRHVEKLKQRQRDSWAPVTTPTVYTLWPRPQRDIRAIEITDTLPVMAFGEPVPDLPPADFVLPWVRTSKAQKRSKRSKTLH